MLDHLEGMGWLTHLRNLPPYDKAGIQFSALKAAARHPLVQEADWILPLDIDEFVNIHVGDHSLSALIAALPEATAITLTWRIFGNAGVISYKDEPVTAQFSRAAPAIIHWPWRAAMFKTLYRNDGTYGKPGIHRPRAPDPARLDSAQWFDGEGRALPARYRRSGLFSQYGRSSMRWCSSTIIRWARWKAMCSRRIVAAPSMPTSALVWITGWSGISTATKM